LIHFDIFLSEPFAYIFSVNYRYIIEGKEIEFFHEEAPEELKKMGKGAVYWISFCALLRKSKIFICINLLNFVVFPLKIGWIF
jgi:hypothetical protein